MFPIQSTLFLIPTSQERDLFQELWMERFNIPFPIPLHICGFGPIASAAATSQLLRPNYNRVCLLGIAGTLNSNAFPIGTATHFSQVNTDCVGAEANDAPLNNGEPAEWLLPSEIKLPQWIAHDSIEVFQSLPLYNLRPPENAQHELLTVGIASGSTHTVDRRRRIFPNCVAEDMEGFSVALAARMANMDCAILRGASNVAGDRNHAQWQIKNALLAVVDLLQPLICY